MLTVEVMMDTGGADRNQIIIYFIALPKFFLSFFF